MSQRTTKPTIRLVRPANTQIRAVWSESSLIGMCLLQPPNYTKERWKKKCHTGWMYRLICVFAGHTGLIVGFIVRWLNYSRLSLSRIPRVYLKHFEMSVPRHIRVAELSKTINRTTIFNKWISNLPPDVTDILKILWKRAISPLFNNTLISVVRFPC